MKMPRDFLGKVFSAVKAFRERCSSAVLRYRVKRRRKARGLSTDLSTVIAEYRKVSPQYADALERALYPADSEDRRSNR